MSDSCSSPVHSEKRSAVCRQDSRLDSEMKFGVFMYASPAIKHLGPFHTEVRAKVHDFVAVRPSYLVSSGFTLQLCDG